MIRIILIVFLCLFYISFSYTLNQKNISEYKIFTNFDGAAYTFEKYIKKITHHPLELVIKDDPEEEFNSKGIYLFICKDECFGFSVTDLKEEGFKIKKVGQNIYILSKSKSGLIYGVYSFLEKLGFKFLSSDFIYVPQHFHIKQLDITENPSFFYREIFVKELDNPKFAQTLKLNGRLGHRENRPLKYGNVYVLTISLNDIVPYERYGKSDPEYFCGNQLDFTNNEVKEIAKLNVDRILSRHKNLENLHVLISPNDVNDYCMNDRSIKRIREGGSPATPYLDFITYIAQDLKEEYPDVKFLALAYLWSRKPPKKYQKLPDNVGIFFSTVEADFSKPLLIRNNTYILRDLEKWTEITDYIFIWHYIANFGNYLIPFPNIYQVADDIKYFSKKKEIKGIFLQGAYNTFGSDLVELKNWIFSKLLWNADQNVDLLLKEFLKYYYGAAAEVVESYIDTLYKYVKKPEIILSIKTPASYLDPDLLKTLYEKLENIEIQNEIYRKHIDKIIFGLNVAILLNQEKITDKSLVKNAKEKIEKYVKNYQITKYSESGNIEDLLNLPVVEQYSEPPDIVKNNRNWIDFQEFSLKLCCSDIVKDKLASNGLAVAIAGWRTDWAVQLDLSNLPEGIWDLYAVVRVQAVEGINPEEIVAFKYGVYPVSETKNAYLEDFYDGEYKTIYIGKYHKNLEYTLWIAPSGNENIEYILVDRIFAVLRN